MKISIKNKTLSLALLLIASFVINAAPEVNEVKKCAVIDFSDVHLYATGDIDVNEGMLENPKSLNYHMYRKSMIDMKSQMDHILKRGFSNKNERVDCISVVLNGDPFNRSKDQKIDFREGFESQSLDKRKQLINLLAQDIKKRLMQDSSCDFKEADWTYNCKKNDLSYTLFFASNIGDHEIPKLDIIKNDNYNDKEVTSVVNELPTLCKERLLLNMRNKAPESLDAFHSELKNSCGITLGPKGSYKWGNGDDVQKLESVGTEIAKTWRANQFYTPSSALHLNSTADDVDPRLGHVITMPDERRYIFSHVDKISSHSDEMNLKAQHDEQKHIKDFWGTVYNGYPEGDPRRDSHYANLTVFTGDSHVARFSLPLAFRKDDRELSRKLVIMTGAKKVINPGSFSSALRQANGLNGYAIAIPEEAPIIRSLSMSDGEISKYNYSNQYIGKWGSLGRDLKATSAELLTLEAKMIADLDKATFVNNNPNKHFRRQAMQKIVDAKDDTRALYKVLEEEGYLKKGNLIARLKEILSAHEPGIDENHPGDNHQLFEEFLFNTLD